MHTSSNTMRRSIHLSFQLTSGNQATQKVEQKIPFKDVTTCSKFGPNNELREKTLDNKGGYFIFVTGIFLIITEQRFVLSKYSDIANIIG